MLLSDRPQAAVSDRPAASNDALDE